MKFNIKLQGIENQMGKIDARTLEIADLLDPNKIFNLIPDDLFNVELLEYRNVKDHLLFNKDLQAQRGPNNERIWVSKLGTIVDIKSFSIKESQGQEVSPDDIKMTLGGIEIDEEKCFDKPDQQFNVIVTIGTSTNNAELFSRLLVESIVRENIIAKLFLSLVPESELEEALKEELPINVYIDVNNFKDNKKLLESFKNKGDLL